MSKKKLTLALMGAAMLSANALAAPELVKYDVNGDGTKDEGEEAYELKDADDLYWFAGLVNGTLDGVDQNTAANAYLANNIVVNSNVLDENGNPNEDPFREWFPIGYYTEDNGYTYYEGTFDGKGNTISGLYFSYEGDQSHKGLFGNINSNATIKNLGVIDSYFYCKSDLTLGGICGYNKGTIENCYSTSIVSCENFFGGVCGYSKGLIANCYNLYGNAVGYSDDGTIEKVETKNQEQFKSGEVTYLLSQGEGGNVWGQDLNNDNYPCHSDKVVYASTCGGIPYEFSNDENSVNTYAEHTIGKDGICQNCRKYYEEPKYDAKNGGYQIVNAGNLYWFAEYVKNSNDENVKVNAVLVNDIVVNESLLSSLDIDKNGDVTNASDLDLIEWSPIGCWIPYVADRFFCGTFDGQGYTISGLYLNNENQNNVGLFGQIGGGVIIKNVGVIDSYFKGGYCIAGVCGSKYGGSITNCYNTSKIRGDKNVGGVCGCSFAGTIENCYNTANVSGEYYVGGVCGSNDESAITNCYNTGSVSGAYSGGVCGFNEYGIIESCYNTGFVSGDEYVGGVCGNNSSTIDDSYNAGNVSGKEYVGDVCGYNDEYGIIENCYDFKVDGGTISEYSIVVNEGYITLPTKGNMSLEGYTFKGWYENAKFNGNAIESEAEFSSTESESDGGVHTLYAKWVGNSTPTAIKAVETENNKTIKTIKDGQIVIIRNGVMYDMQGRKM